MAEIQIRKCTTYGQQQKCDGKTGRGYRKGATFGKTSSEIRYTLRKTKPLPKKLICIKKP